ncbi:hypothetical protein [Thermaerobacillus caldiproteolyticus]|uniref:Nucleotidyltransferase n=1 Tax=Thermaerobacillus caldiproteolyticus TaxID=247480 RepID=A0A7V9Z714_9BACL|nr:hypothetical protein [Anoxybacillus caldiproteolyticus]MBA2875262.1 hypothetical protein [Anoxybacillus caldiproteolyticus]
MEAKPIVKQAAEVYIKHTEKDFIGLIVHGSAMKGGFISGSSDIDFQLYLKESAFDENGRLPLELSLAIHRDLAKINPYPFSYIQCRALSSKLPDGYVGPIPGAYHLVAGRLPVNEATNEQLKQSAINALRNLTPVPKYLNNLLDHGKERLSRMIRLLCTQVSPVVYQVLSIEQEDAVKVWQMPKNEAIKLLPDEEMKAYAERFYEHAKRYYSNETSIEDALKLIENGVAFFKSVQLWYKRAD